MIKKLFLLIVSLFVSQLDIYAYEPATAKKYELTPYQIHICLTLPFAPQFNTGRLQSLQTDIARDLNRFSLSSINYVISLEQGFPLKNPLDNLAFANQVQPLNDKISMLNSAQGFDKLISSSVILENNTFHLHTQEYDALTDTISPLLISETEDLDSLARLISHDITRAFRPLILLTQTKDNKFAASLKAGELGWPEPANSQITPGDFFTIFHLYQDKKGIVQKRLPANWTYLKLTEQDRGELKLDLVSAFRAPIAAAKRRVQIIGIQAKPVLNLTPLQVTRGNNNTPCPGSTIRVFPVKVRPPLPGEKPVSPLQTLMTDRYGHTTIITPKDQQLIYLYPLSGDIVLGTVPLVPGSQSLIKLQVPDDQLRLGVEAQLSQLNAVMIDIVAARTIIFARLKRFIDQEKWSEYDLVRPQINQLNKADDFRSRLNAIRVFGIEAAQKDKNKITEKRIGSMCDESQNLFNKYFGDTNIIEEIKEFDNVRNANKK